MDAASSSSGTPLEYSISCAVFIPPGVPHLQSTGSNTSARTTFPSPPSAAAAAAAGTAGLLNCTYTAFRSGLYALSLLLDGEPLAGSPSIVPVLPGGADALTSELRSPFLLPTLSDSVYPAAAGSSTSSELLMLDAGVPTLVDIVLRDPFGNRVGRNGIDPSLVFLRLVSHVPRSTGKDMLLTTAVPLPTSVSAAADGVVRGLLAPTQAAAASAGEAALLADAVTVAAGVPIPTSSPSITSLEAALATAGSGVDVDVYSLPNCELGSLIGSELQGTVGHAISPSYASGVSSSGGSNGSASPPPSLLASVIVARGASACVRKYGFLRPVFGLSSTDVPANGNMGAIPNVSTSTGSRSSDGCGGGIRLRESVSFTVRSNGGVRLYMLLYPQAEHSSGGLAARHQLFPSDADGLIKSVRGPFPPPPPPPTSTPASFDSSGSGGGSGRGTSLSAWRLLLDSSTTRTSSASASVLTATVELESGVFYGYMLEYTAHSLSRGSGGTTSSSAAAVGGGSSSHACDDAVRGCYLDIVMQSPSISSSLLSLSPRRPSPPRPLPLPSMFLISASSGVSAIGASPYGVRVRPGAAVPARTIVRVPTAAVAPIGGRNISSSPGAAWSVISPTMPGSYHDHSRRAEDVNIFGAADSPDPLPLLTVVGSQPLAILLTPLDGYGNDRAVGGAAALDSVLAFVIPQGASDSVLPPSAFTATYPGSGHILVTFTPRDGVRLPARGAPTSATLLLFVCLNPPPEVVASATAASREYAAASDEVGDKNDATGTTPVGITTGAAARLLDASSAAGCLVTTTPLRVQVVAE